MKPAILWAAIVCALLAAFPAFADTSEAVALGGQEIIRLPDPITRVALGDPAIADVKLLSRHQLRLVGLKAGATSLTVWCGKNPDGETYNIVVGPNVAALQTRLAAVPALHDVAAISTPQGVTLAGDAPSLDAKQQAAALAQGENGGAPNDQVAVTGPRMIAVEVRFAAVSADTLKTLGINFQKLSGGFQLT